MSEEQEQRVCIKFCVKLGRNGAGTFEMLRTAIPKDSFKKCFQQWQDRWKQCVSSQGEYFENY